MAPQTPVLGITMGDPAGVGPEITAKALARPDVTAACRPVVIGDGAIMAATLAMLQSPLRLHAVKRVGDCAFAAGTLECLDLANVDAAGLPRGAVSAEAGRAAYAYIETAVATVPVGRDRRHRDRPGEQGSARRRRRPALRAHGDPRQALGDDRLRHAADGQGAPRDPRHHARLAPPRPRPGDARPGGARDPARAADDDVSRRGAAEDRRVRAQSARRGRRALRRRGEEGDHPRRRSGARATASTSTVPCPPTRSSRARGAASSTSSSRCTTTRGMCRSRRSASTTTRPSGTWTGLSGVNVTVGLPFLRVSVDHGTAFDRAWKGIANPESMVEALEVAVRMLRAHRAG